MSSSEDELQRAHLTDMAEVFITASKIRQAELNIKPRPPELYYCCCCCCGWRSLWKDEGQLSSPRSPQKKKFSNCLFKGIHNAHGNAAVCNTGAGPLRLSCRERWLCSDPSSQVRDKKNMRNHLHISITSTSQLQNNTNKKKHENVYLYTVNRYLV